MFKTWFFFNGWINYRHGYLVTDKFHLAHNNRSSTSMETWTVTNLDLAGQKSRFFEFIGV